MDYDTSAFDGFVKMTGELELVLRDADGAIKDRVHVPNLVVTTGKNIIADRMKGTPALGAMSHMGVGTGSTAPAVGDTALGAQVGSRVALTSTNVSGAVITYVATFGAGVGTGALQEAGLFNSATTTGTDMLCRTTYSVINKGASDSLTITWTVTIN